MNSKELLTYAQQGDAHAIELLLTKHKRIVYYKAKTFFIIGGDLDDLIQEGLIGLYEAICDYDENKQVSFIYFAELCIVRKIISSIKLANRLKHSPLNSYISIYKPVENKDSNRSLLETIINNETIEPSVFLEEKERLIQIKNKLMEVLSDLEWNVLCLFVQGWSYEEISKMLNRHYKAIDNTMQRIRRKAVRLADERVFIENK